MNSRGSIGFPGGMPGAYSLMPSGGRIAGPRKENITEMPMNTSALGDYRAGQLISKPSSQLEAQLSLVTAAATPPESTRESRGLQ